MLKAREATESALGDKVKDSSRAIAAAWASWALSDGIKLAFS